MWHSTSLFANSVSSPGEEAVSSVPSSSAGARSVPSSSIPRRERCSCADKRTVCWTCSPSGTMSRPSMLERGVARWISYLAGFPASPGARPEPALLYGVRLIRAISGRTPVASSPRAAPPLFYLRTSLASSPAITSSASFRISMRSGLLYAGIFSPLPQSELLISASGSGSPAGSWPTPRASEWKGSGPYGSPSQKYRLDRKYLDATVVEREAERRGLTGGAPIPRNWPTPAAHDGKGMRGPGFSTTGRHYLPHDLPSAVRRWPTPTAGDASSSPKASPSGPDQAKASRYLRGNRQESRSESLPTQVAHLSGGALNPDWVEWLMGWPVGWTACAPLATVRFQRWCERHGIYSVRHE